MAAKLKVVEKHFQIARCVFSQKSFGRWVDSIKKRKKVIGTLNSVRKSPTRKLENVNKITHHARQTGHAWRTSFARVTSKTNQSSFALENRTNSQYTTVTFRGLDSKLYNLNENSRFSIETEKELRNVSAEPSN